MQRPDKTGPAALLAAATLAALLVGATAAASSSAQPNVDFDYLVLARQDAVGKNSTPAEGRPRSRFKGRQGLLRSRALAVGHAAAAAGAAALPCAEQHALIRRAVTQGSHCA